MAVHPDSDRVELQLWVPVERAPQLRRARAREPYLRFRSAFRNLSSYIPYVQTSVSSQKRCVRWPGSRPVPQEAQRKRSPIIQRGRELMYVYLEHLSGCTPNTYVHKLHETSCRVCQYVYGCRRSVAGALGANVRCGTRRSGSSLYFSGPSPGDA